MKTEYLLFNILVVIGPVLLSFDQKIRYYKKWKTAILASLFILPWFVIWDILVTNRHWFFNEKFTLGFKVLKLPIEEWLFFITVPFSCLFIWEIISRQKEKVLSKYPIHVILYFISFPLGVYFYLRDNEYTSLVCFVFGILTVVDDFSHTRLLKQTRILPFLAIVMLLILVFNGYLTARPVVTYDASYQLNFRVFTIPIEDFVYGISHILFCTIAYEKLKGLA